MIIDNINIKDIPTSDMPGGFGYIRKFDIHTGIDIYCAENTPVYAIRDGIVVNIEDFTGVDSNPPTPWWYDTQSILIEDSTNVICYGEISVNNLKIGDIIRKGDVIGYIKQVLKKDKGLPMCMLHVELYEKGIKESVVWNLNEPIPKGLLDISTIQNELL